MKCFFHPIDPAGFAANDIWLCEPCSQDEGLIGRISFYGWAHHLLVEQAGASPVDRPSFIRYFIEGDRAQAREWRFQGKLGFGGKFWRNDGQHYVDCYPEDRTPERDELIEQVNENLRELRHG